MASALSTNFSLSVLEGEKGEQGEQGPRELSFPQASALADDVLPRSWN